MRRMTITLPLSDAAKSETDAVLVALEKLLRPGGATPVAQAEIKKLARVAQRKAAQCR